MVCFIKTSRVGDPIRSEERQRMKLSIHATPNARHDAVRVMLDAVGDMLEAVVGMHDAVDYEST